jgi:anti-sigma factor RsiW
MTTLHEDFLELAAASLDFELDLGEREALDKHLAGCVPCRRQMTGLQADQRAIAQMPMFVLSSADAARLRKRSGQSGRRTVSTFRLIAIAAVLALLSGAAIVVGSAVSQRQHDVKLSVVQPSPSAAAQTPSATTTPTSVGPSDAFAADTVVEVVSTTLRVRTAPTVDNTKSVKLEPLLGLGAQLQVIDGPVSADGYDWYLVQAVGLPHRGWVAAADHDGTPWIENLTIAASPSPAFSSN